MATQQTTAPRKEKLQKWNIVGGPQKWEFLDALETRDRDTRLRFSLQDRKGSTIMIAEAEILTIGRKRFFPRGGDHPEKDRSSWSFFAKIAYFPSPTKRIVGTPVRAWYSTNSPRLGTMEEISREYEVILLETFCD